MPMAYDPGALEAALAAAVGDEPGLIAELRSAFFASAQAHVEALRRATTIDGWHSAAVKLHSLAASFGAMRLMDAATDAAQSPKIDASQLRKIERVIAALDL
jgi:histidine phosphotransfer protein HptB